MAGNSNSGRPRKSDEEKKRNGTFRADRSEAAYAEKNAGKVITGVFLDAIPVPNFPLDDFGKVTYRKFAQLLLDQGKLTAVSAAECESLGIVDMRINAKMTAGKVPTADDLKQRSSIIMRLRVAEDAPVIAEGGTKNRFTGAGFSNSRSSPYRLRPYRTPDTGKL